MKQFLHKFACFDCQVAFKRPATMDASTGTAHQSESEITHMCPNCGHKMAFVGRNFAAPSKNNNSSWYAAKRLWESGFRYCGNGYHSDPPLPKNKTDVENFIKNNIKHSQKVSKEIKWSQYA